MTYNVTTAVVDQADLGVMRLFAQPHIGAPVELTSFRNKPMTLGDFSFADPFGDESFTFSTNTITLFDTPGSGDLYWMMPWTDVWLVLDNSGVQTTVWEGFIASWSYTTNSEGYSTNFECKGALYIIDNLLAVPFYPSRPVPYEYLIARLFRRAADRTMSVGPLTLDYTGAQLVTYDPLNFTQFTRPIFLEAGQQWSGLVTRDTGSGQEQALTGLVARLLSTMYDPSGNQYTLTKATGRIPVLKLRRSKIDMDTQTLIIDLTAPGIGSSMSQDWTQTANIIYGAGTYLDGTKFDSNPIGEFTSIDISQDENPGIDYFDYSTAAPKPFAYDPNAYLPAARGAMQVPKEIFMEFAPGLSAGDSIVVANRHLRLNSDPGWAGTITLEQDPSQATVVVTDTALSRAGLGNLDVVASGTTFPRVNIREGMTIAVQGLGNATVLLHISKVSISATNLSTTLTVDSKFRDALTIEEVRARTYDSMNVYGGLRSTTSPTMQKPVSDLLLPWRAERGAGIIPSATVDGFHNAKPLFDIIDAYRNADGSPLSFPWTAVTTAYPPKSYPNYYIPIYAQAPDANLASLSGAVLKGRNSDYYWSMTRSHGTTGGWMAYPIVASAAASISLTQIVALDGNGNVLPVYFHASIYNVNLGGTGNPLDNVPAIVKYSSGASGIPLKQRRTNADGSNYFPETRTSTVDGYNAQYNAAAQAVGSPTQRDNHYPFYDGAWSGVPTNLIPETFPTFITRMEGPPGALCVGWGNYLEPAGYSPFMFSDGSPPTGMLIDTVGWNYDLSNSLNMLQNDVSANDSLQMSGTDVGYLWILIYCDMAALDTVGGVANQDVYFVGRIYHQSPGTM